MTTALLRRFTDVLNLLNRGRFTEKCDEHLANAIETLEALPSEKGTAKITIELTVNFDSGRVDIVPKVVSKLPEGKVFAATALWTHEGGLSVQHPSQIDIFSGPEDAAERQRRRDASGA